MKAVLDSGILISAFLTPKGISADILRIARKELFQIYLCNEILVEVQRVLLKYPHIRDRYSYSNRQATIFCEGLKDAVNIVTKIPTIKAVVNDPNDDMVVACAVKARAHFIVSRDEDLLGLKKYKGIMIIAPEEFMEILRKENI